MPEAGRRSTQVELQHRQAELLVVPPERHRQPLELLVPRVQPRAQQERPGPQEGQVPEPLEVQERELLEVQPTRLLGRWSVERPVGGAD